MTQYNLIDIEASGLDIESYPIEVGILFENTVHTWLIKPEPRWQHWDDAAEKIHGLLRQHILRQGMDAKQVAIEINELVKNSNGLLYSDAVQWDSDWINHLFRTVGVITEFHLLPIQDLFSENEESLFKQQRTQIVLSGKYRQHRAGEDVQLINRALKTVFDSRRK